MSGILTAIITPAGVVPYPVAQRQGITCCHYSKLGQRRVRNGDRVPVCRHVMRRCHLFKSVAFYKSEEKLAVIFGHYDCGKTVPNAKIKTPLLIYQTRLRSSRASEKDSEPHRLRIIEQRLAYGDRGMEKRLRRAPQALEVARLAIEI